WPLVESEGVTHLSGSPNLFTVLLNHSNRPKSFKQPLIFGIGGSQPSPGLIARSQELGIRVIHGYGLTETYGPCTICEPQSEWQHLPALQAATVLARQGGPSIMGDAVRVVDENMGDVRRGGESLGEGGLRGA